MLYVILGVLSILTILGGVRFEKDHHKMKIFLVCFAAFLGVSISISLILHCSPSWAYGYCNEEKVDNSYIVNESSVELSPFGDGSYVKYDVHGNPYYHYVKDNGILGTDEGTSFFLDDDNNPINKNDILVKCEKIKSDSANTSDDADNFVTTSQSDKGYTAYIDKYEIKVKHTIKNNVNPIMKVLINQLNADRNSLDYRYKANVIISQYN